MPLSNFGKFSNQPTCIKETFIHNFITISKLVKASGLLQY